MSQYDLVENDSPIVSEDGRPVLSGTGVSLYAIIDGLNAGITPARIQTALRASVHDMNIIMAYINRHRSTLDHTYQQEITQFTEDLLTRLEGMHQPSWKDRSKLIGWLLAVFCFSYLTTLGWSPLFLVVFIAIDVFLLVLWVAASIKLFRLKISVGNQQFTVVDFPNSRSFTLGCQDIARLIVNCRWLVVIARDGTTHSIYLTDSIKTILNAMFEESRYDNWLHFHCHRGF